MNKIYIETYGCQMNQYDTELVHSILKNENYEFTNDSQMADIIMLNTCSVRGSATNKVFARIGDLFSLRNNENTIILKEDLKNVQADNY